MPTDRVSEGGVSGGGAKTHIPPLLQRAQIQPLGQIGGLHGVGQVLLVGEYQKYCFPQILFAHHFMEFIPKRRSTSVSTRWTDLCATAAGRRGRGMDTLARAQT